MRIKREFWTFHQANSEMYLRHDIIVEHYITFTSTSLKKNQIELQDPYSLTYGKLGNDERQEEKRTSHNGRP